MARKKGLLNDPERRKASIRAAIDALPMPTDLSGDRTVSLSVPEATWVLLRRAAVEREISPAAYARRAMYAMVAHDLGVPVTLLLADDPSVARYTGAAILDPEGVKFGSWQIEGLVGDDRPAQ